MKVACSSFLSSFLLWSQLLPLDIATVMAQSRQLKMEKSGKGWKKSVSEGAGNKSRKQNNILPYPFEVSPVPGKKLGKSSKILISHFNHASIWGQEKTIQPLTIKSTNAVTTTNGR